MSTWGSLIREAREARGWSLVQMGAALGVNASTVLRWERDESAPLYRRALEIKAELGIEDDES